jgi:microcystin-dependent protein
VQGVGIPTPVVNGQWIKGVGGAAVWTAIAPADVTGAALIAADAAWTVMSLGSGASAYGSPYGPPRYRKTATNWVICDGLVTVAVVNGTAFTFPVGYRPSPQAGARDLIFVCAQQVAPTTGWETWRVNETGAMRLNNGNAVGQWISMSGVAFYAGRERERSESCDDTMDPALGYRRCRRSGPIPLGSVLEWPWGAGQLPNWALLPYGQLLTQAAYPAMQVLADAASRPYGGSAGVNFNLPDYRGRVGVGKDDMGGTAASRITTAISGINGATLGAVGGAESVVLVTAQLPAHNHTGTSDNDSPDHTHSGSTGNDTPDHAHGFATGGVSANHRHIVTMQRSTGYGLTSSGPGYAGNVAIVPGGGGTDVSYWSGYIEVDHSHSGTSYGANARHAHPFTSGGRSVYHQHTFTTANTGSGSATPIVQPTIIVNKLMRVL